MLNKFNKAFCLIKSGDFSLLIKKISRVMVFRQYRQFINSLRKSIFVLRKRFWGDETVKIHGLVIDVSDEIFSEKIRSKIILKQYERKEIELIKKYLIPQVPVIDLGAGIGITSTYLRRFITDSVIAVEADKRLISLIENTKKINQVEFPVLNKAYHPHGGKVKLNIGDNYWSSSIVGTSSKQNGFQQEVQASNLEEILKLFGSGNKFQLVVDIEGMEYDLLSEEIQILKERCVAGVFEYHQIDDTEIDDYFELLCRNGFELKFHPSDDNVVVFLKEEIM